MIDPPSIAALNRRLAETPGEFLANSGTDLAAIVSDLVRDLGGETFDSKRAAPFAGAGDPRRLALIGIAAWLFHDEWFVERRAFDERLYEFLARGLDDLSTAVGPAQFVNDPDRREELARRALRAIGVLPQGETATQAADRLATLDSLERLRVLRETRAAQERTRRIQEAMRKKAAEEAASAYGRE